MTTITAQVVADSVSPEGKRITTMQLRYPRPIHAELMTHRVFSRNASSSRAIPVERLIQDVLDDPFVPLHWGLNQKGMQAEEECNEPVIDFWPYEDENGKTVYGETAVSRESYWLTARDEAIGRARGYAKAGYHKQIVNRLLEPFAHINVVVTATEWANFLWLRDHKDAEPHIAILAREIRAAMDASTPELLEAGEWHLPYANDVETVSTVKRRWGALGYPVEGKVLEDLRKISVARCASVSYKTVDGLPMTIERATALYDKLVAGEPLHASPTEHQATPDEMRSGTTEGHEWTEWAKPELHGNFSGWIQFRKTLPGENHTG